MPAVERCESNNLHDGTMATKKTVKAHGKKLTILKAAREVISDKGIKDATITEIAKKAGVFDSIIYHYFKNKEHLVFDLLDMELRDALDELSFHFQGIIDPVSKLGKMMWYHLQMNARGNPRMRKNILMECRAHRNFQNHSSYETLMQYVGIMDGILREGIASGAFRQNLIIPVIRTMILGLLDEESFLDLTGGKPASALQDFENLVALVLHIIAKPAEEKSDSEKPDKYVTILQAAKVIFAEKGYNNTTMLDVAGRAGVAEGTIYEYFKNKQDLLFSISKHYVTIQRNFL